MNEKGTISVHTENIFPIIKRFLYSDQDIFLRELVANGVDAVEKLKRLSAMGLYEGPIDALSIEVSINSAQKTITITDNGLGMTADEIKQYINQIAFSGATAFVEKFKQQTDTQQLIGCFGLGFYAAFMVAKKVEIITQSYQKNATAVHWSCDGSTNFEIAPTTKQGIGTMVVLHLSEEAEEFLQKERIQAILTKHCRFLPIEILFDGKIINDIQPLWVKNPSDLTDDDYLKFYKTLYPYAAPPLFWVHLNIDYPFTLTGILYFPKSAHYFEQKETIQLYAKQVFITNDVKEVIPDFLRLLHGVIDSPDIPLNVSRSALQADSNVKKINTYIAKKVAEKLETLFEQDRQGYEQKWNDIALFIKYGMITDEKFEAKIKDIVLLQNRAGEFYTMQEYEDKTSENQTDKNGDLIWLYTTDPLKHAVYLQAIAQQGYDALLLNSPIDTNFINFCEHKRSTIKYKGVDTDTLSNLIEKEASPTYALSETEMEKLKGIYEKNLDSAHITWTMSAMLPDELPVAVITSELVRRMEHFTPGSDRDKATSRSMHLAINCNHPLAKSILDASDEVMQKNLVMDSYYVSLLAHGCLEGELLSDFMKGYIGRLLSHS